MEACSAVCEDYNRFWVNPHDSKFFIPEFLHLVSLMAWLKGGIKEVWKHDARELCVSYNGMFVQDIFL